MILFLNLTRTIMYAGNAVGFLDHDNKSPVFCWFKGLRLQHYDDQNHICNLEMDSMTMAGIHKAPLRDPMLTQSEVQDLVAWSEAQTGLMQQLRSRISRLIHPVGP